MEHSKINLLPLLDYIDPSFCTYQEWVQVGMALKIEGYDVSDWDAWSRRDGGRYHAGECAQKWRTFTGTDSPVTGATIVDMAKKAAGAARPTAAMPMTGTI